jgi:pyruvate dehydrogenase E2 component (dihydrolipoamide acetyltransferase)
MHNMTVPSLGEGIDTVEVVAWNFRPGEKVTPEDDVVELVTDKAVFNLPAPVTGLLRNIYIPAGQQASVGTVLADIENV